MILTSVSPWLRNQLKTPSKMDFSVICKLRQSSRSAFGPYFRFMGWRVVCFGDFRISIVSRGGFLGGWARYIRWDSKTPGEIESARVDLVGSRLYFVDFSSGSAVPSEKYAKNHKILNEFQWGCIFSMFALSNSSSGTCGIINYFLSTPSDLGDGF